MKMTNQRNKSFLFNHLKFWNIPLENVSNAAERYDGINQTTAIFRSNWHFDIDMEVTATNEKQSAESAENAQNKIKNKFY